MIGCGPIEYIDVSTKAGAALLAAKNADAERLAPYEYTAAAAYLHKAREEAGYSEYQVSIEFGRRAEALATRARALAQAKAQGEPAPNAATTVPAAVTSAPLTVVPAPVPATAPPPEAAPKRAPAVDGETPRK